MSWRDNSSSDTRSSTSDSNGGSKSNASSGSKDSKGPNYTQRTVPGAKTPKTGNWNTGGSVVSTGSFDKGYTPLGEKMRTVQPMAQRPTQRPLVVPPVVPLPPVKPPVPIEPTIVPQNYGFVAPTTPPVAPVKPTIAPQNYGFVAPAPRATVPAGQKVTDVFGPSYAQDPSIRGRVEANSNVPAGQKITDVFGPSYARDPQIAGRLEATRQPGYGVPDSFPNETVINKTPPSKQFTDSLTPGVDNPAIFNANYPQAQRPPMTPGQVFGNQTVNDAIHPTSILNRSRNPAVEPASAPNGPTFGPETPVGNEDWQRGPTINPASSPLGKTMGGLGGRVPTPRSNPMRSAGVPWR